MHYTLPVYSDGCAFVLKPNGYVTPINMQELEAQLIQADADGARTKLIALMVFFLWMGFYRT